MRISYDFGDLETFLEVAEAGSFQLAAQHLNVSQSSVTRRVQKLETNLGAKLFTRTTRSVRLTLPGKSLVARAQAMIDEALEMTRAIKDENSEFEYQRNSIVTVAAVPSAISKILPQAVQQFRRNGHVARIRILDQLANDVAEAVAQGEADFGITSIPAMDPNIVFEPLVDDRIVLAVPADHSLAQTEVATWADLQGEELILPMKGTGNRLLIDDAIARSEEVITWSIEVQRTSPALGLVKAGVGVATLPESAIPPDAFSQVRTLMLKSPEIIRQIGIVTRTGQVMSRPAAKLLSLLRSTGS